MKAARRYYADQFQHVFGLPLDQAWQNWIGFEREFQNRNLAEVRRFPITPDHKLVALRTRLGIASCTTKKGAALCTRLSATPGTLEHVVALNTRDGSARNLADVKGAMHYRVTSFAYDPGQRARRFISITIEQCAILCP